MNEGTNIILLDVFVVLTNVLNDGNVNDLNGGSVIDLPLQKERMATIYITVFVANVVVHLALLLVTQV